MHKCDMVMDFQFGSTGKGLIAGYLANRENYDTAICSFATNAGHTYKSFVRATDVMTQQLPTSIISPSVKQILIGPGSAIHAATFLSEIERYKEFIKGKVILIHPQAAVVEDYHAQAEVADGRTKMGSTGKGVGDAFIERIKRKTDNPNNAGNRWWDGPIGKYLASEVEYRNALDRAESVIVEGAQGFSLSMYHGFYPYTTSRDVTPWQIAADCGIPFKWAPYIQIIGTLRTFPIRVNNRDGSSGPGYHDQQEIPWNRIGVEPELTTVTKLPRRLFEFSREQLTQALFHCGGYWTTKLFLNFCNYLDGHESVEKLIKQIETPMELAYNAPRVEWLGYGPDDANVMTRNEWAEHINAAAAV